MLFGERERVELVGQSMGALAGFGELPNIVVQELPVLDEPAERVALPGRSARGPSEDLLKNLHRARHWSRWSERPTLIDSLDDMAANFPL
jgi:hypothetical protein